MNKRALKRICVFWLSFTLIFTFFPVMKTPKSYAAYDPGFSAGGYAYGISAFRDGYVYAAIWDEQKISRISLTDHSITDVVLGSNTIKSVAVNRGGDLFFAYYNDNKIYKIPAPALASLPVNAESAAEVFYTVTAAEGGTDYLESIAFDPNDNLYMVLNTFSGSWQFNIKVIAAGGTAIARTIPTTFAANGVALTPFGDLYVLSEHKGLYKASRSALDQVEVVFESLGNVNGDTPFDLTVLPDGKLVYSDWRQSAISYAGITVEPHAPSVMATGNSGEVSLTWDALPGITGYNVYQSEVAASLGSRIATVTEATYTVPGLVNGTTYYFGVRAINSIDEGPAFDQASATPTEPVPTPSDPSNNDVEAAMRDIFEGESMTLSATGDRQDANGATIGDERYVPATWVSTEPGLSGTFVPGADGYTSSYTATRAGDHTLTATFQKQVWNGTDWVDVGGEIDTKTISLKVVSASAALPTRRDAREIDEHDGYVYTAHRGSGEITRTSVADKTVETVVDGIDDVMTVALSGNGDLYYTRDSDFHIYKIPASLLVSLPVNAGEAEIAYTDPDSDYHYSLEVDATGVLYFSSIANGTTSLRKWDNGSAATVIDSLERGISGLAFAPTGDLYILNGWREIYKATASQLASESPFSLAFVTQLEGDTAGLAILQDGKIVHTDYERNRYIWYSGYVIPILKTADPARNRVETISTYITLGGTIVLSAAGDWQNAEGRLIGDERYIPINWASTEPGQSGVFTLGDNGYTSSYTPATAGNHKVTATFQKETWNGSRWIAINGSTDTKAVDIFVGSGLWSELDEGLDVLGGWNGAYSTAVDRDGNVYVTDTQNDRILKRAVSGEYAGAWRELVIDVSGGPSTLNRPRGIATDGDGNIYVADSGNHRLLKLSVTGTWSELSADLGSELGELVFPFAIAVDNDGNMYVTEMGHEGVLMFDADTQTWSIIDEPGGPAGANGLAIDDYGNLYASDTAGSRILKWTVSGEGAGAWSELGDGPGSSLGQFQYPNGIAVDGNGNVYVADSVNDRIQIRMAATGTWSEWKTPGESLGGFNKPTGIAADHLGNVYAVDNANNRVLLMTPLIQYPGAPTGVTAVAGDGKATVRFTAPANDGGSPITGYTVTANPGGIEASGQGSPIVVGGLTNGKSYTFTVKASNAAGSSRSSVVSNAIVPQPSANGNGDGNNGSTSSGSGEPASSESTGVEVLINGVAENAGTAITTQRAGQTVITITLDRQKLADKLLTGGPNTVVKIPVQPGADAVVGQLNGQMVKDMESKQAVLVIETDYASYTLPAQQINIDAISRQIGKTVTLADIQVQVELAISSTETVKAVENAAVKGQFTLVVPPVNFAIRGIYGESSYEVTRFNAYVDRTIAIPAGVDPRKITTGVVVDPDGTVRHVPTRVFEIEGKYYARINSLTNSTYTLVWHPLEFRDVADHWAKAAVNDMGSRMVVGGAGNDLFKPDAEVSRAEFAAILVRGLGLAPERGTAEFSDVPQNAWYNESVRAAFANGLIKGFDDGTFRPNAKITREEAMTVISRAMKITGLHANGGAEASEERLNAFKDMDSASEWAKPGISDVLRARIVSGQGNGLLAPKSFVSRAEAAVMIRQLLQRSELI